MKRTSVVICSLSATILGITALAQAPLSEMDAHIATARAAAGQDYRATFVNLCLPSAPRGGGAGRGGAGAAGRGAATPPQTPDRANWYAPPFKVFDNLYWLGTRQHSSWALQTSAGIVIIDTNFAWATRPEIIDGLTKLGVNPNDIKYVIISHAHGDHDQGAAELQERYGAQVVMGTRRLGGYVEAAGHRPGGVPKRDIAVGPEGRKLTLGDTTVEIVSTPGHTPGTLSYVFPVKDQGRTVMVAYSGGTLTGAFGTDGARWDEYIASQRKIAKVAADAGATRHPVQPQRIRRRLHEGAPDRRASPARRKSSVHRRRRRCATILYGDGGVRDGVQAAGRREIGDAKPVPRDLVWLAASIPGVGLVLAQQPTFQVSVNSVDVDVTVTDAQGNFVTGVTASDFEVFEDGKPQTIQTFSYIELPRLRPSSFAFGGRPVASDVRSNRDVASGRVYIIVLDDLNVAPLRTAIVRRHARDFIEKHFSSNDLAAVVSTSGRKDAGQEFTSDPALLLRAIDNFFGQRLQSAEVQRIDNYYQTQLLSGLDQKTQDGTSVPNLLTQIQSFDPSNLERGQRAVGVLQTMRSLAEFLEGVRGRRKALLWFSEGIDYPMAEAFSSQSGNEILQATRDAVNAAARANVNVFALDPRGLIGMTTDFIDMTRTGGPDYAGTDPTKPAGTPFSGVQALLGEMRLTQDSLRMLADGTGGFAAVDTNSFADAFDRIIEANSRYYLLGYTPPAHPRDGRFHRIEVSVKRPGLKAIARRGYPSPSGKTVDERRQEALERWKRDRRAGGANDTSTELRAALNSPVQQPGLTLSVQAAPFKGAAKERLWR